MNYDVVMLAGGRGERSKLPYNKVFHEIRGKWVLDYALRPFLKDNRCQSIVLVYNLEDKTRIFERYADNEAILLVEGGSLRQNSVANGLKHVSAPLVLIHDGARPFVDTAVIDRVLQGLSKSEACASGIAIPDTVKRVESGRIVEAVDREGLVRLQTPQGFKTTAIKAAYKYEGQAVFSCDISLYEAFSGKKALVVQGDERNMKFTRMEDVTLLELMADAADRP